MKSTVYFSPEITPEKVLELFKLVGKELPGRVAIKVHSGEKGNQNFLRPRVLEAHRRLRGRHRGGVQHCL